MQSAVHFHKQQQNQKPQHRKTQDMKMMHVDMANKHSGEKGCLQKVLEQTFAAHIVSAEEAQVILTDYLDPVKKYLGLGKKVIQLRWNVGIESATGLQSQFGLDRLRIIVPSAASLLQQIAKDFSEMAEGE